MDSASKDNQDRERRRRSGGVRTISNRILELASGASPRPQFLREVLQMLVRFSECDLLRLVLIDGTRRFRCEISGDGGPPFQYDENRVSPGETTALWSGDGDSAWERLCRDIIHRRIASEADWFTRNGSLWTEDVGTLTLPGILDDASQGPGIRIDTGMKALALIPVEAGQERVGLLQFQSRRAGVCDEEKVEVLERLAQIFGIALDQRGLRVALRERVKELSCLCQIAMLGVRPGLNLEALLQQTVDLLPLAWLYPDVTVARIVFDGRQYTSANYRATPQRLTAAIAIDGENRGEVEVAYTWEKPHLDEGPFLREERKLIDTIAQELSLIIEQRLQDEERQRLEIQLQHADRLATIGQLAAGVAHELNEPLANILGFAELSIKDGGLSKQTHQDINRIITSTLHAREVIKKLLVFARDSAPTRVRLSLNELVDDGLYFLESRCHRADIDLFRDTAEALPDLLANRSQMMQVLTNLIVNAIQAMPEGGRLTVRTRWDGDFAVLVVKDSGVGIHPDLQKKIFNPFFTTKEVDEGTGLGLSVVHGIVMSHGGEIEVDSRPGMGATFIIRLPLADTIDHGNREHD